MPANYHHHIQSIGALRVVRCSSMLYGECSAHHGAVYLNGEQPKSRWIVRENNFNCSNWLCRFLRKRKKKKEKTEKFPFIGVARSGQRIVKLSIEHKLALTHSVSRAHKWIAKRTHTRTAHTFPIVRSRTIGEKCHKTRVDKSWNPPKASGGYPHRGRRCECDETISDSRFPCIHNPVADTIPYSLIGWLRRGAQAKNIEKSDKWQMERRTKIISNTMWLCCRRNA